MEAKKVLSIVDFTASNTEINITNLPRKTITVSREEQRAGNVNLDNNKVSKTKRINKLQINKLENTKRSMK